MSKKSIVIIIILILVVILIGGGYFVLRSVLGIFPRTDLGKNQNLTEQTPEPVAGKPPAAEIKSPAPKTETTFPGFKLYKNTEFGFEIQYPDSWTVTEEINENVRGEMVKEYYFKKPNSDLRFAILPRDGLSYGVGAKGTSTPVFIGGSPGMQTQYILKDGRRLWLLFPQYGLYNWLEDLGRLDIMTSALDPAGDTQIFEKMLNSFKLLNL